MKIIVAGGTGFIGKLLVDTLTRERYEVVILTRGPSRPGKEPSVRYIQWNPPQGGDWEKELEGSRGVVNLAGETIAAKRWTKKRRLELLESRCDATQAIARAIEKAKAKPAFLLNASAMGFYGTHESSAFAEDSGAGDDFLAKICKAWEAHAIRAEDFGVRVVRLRIGIVLEKGGGALAKMLPPFQFFLGGPLGSGRQWMSWIHLTDVVGLILFLMRREDAKGPFNVTAPQPVTMEEFARTLGKVLRRPASFRVPGLVLKILLGAMADLLLKGQKVIPQKALDLGYRFQYPDLESALRASVL